MKQEARVMRNAEPKARSWLGHIEERRSKTYELMHDHGKPRDHKRRGWGNVSSHQQFEKNPLTTSS